MVGPSIVKPSTNQLGIFPCRLYPARGLLLEGMKYVDRVLKFDRVHRSIGVSAMVLDYFEAPWSFPSPRFRAWVLATKLRNAESGSNFIDHRLWESQQVILAGSGPEQWLLAGDPLRSRHVIIPVLGYHVKLRIPQILS